ncbi:MAG: hypothetical protein NVS2B3_08860 [Vulcanimicrobiaceae bacterium]
MTTAIRERDGVVAYRLWAMQPRGCLGPYYIDWTTNGVAETWRSDDDPIAIAKTALDLHGAWYATRTAADRERFLRQATRLRECAQDAGRFPLSTGFLSATAQSLAVSALIRADALEKNAGHLDAAVRASASLRLAIADGGVLFRACGDTIFEDVAALPPEHRLRGSVMGCFALIELQRVAFLPWAGAILGSAIGTLQRRISLYDLDGWSSGSAVDGPSERRDVDVADADTHELHIALLHVFSSMIGDANFERLARAWARRRDPAIERRSRA